MFSGIVETVGRVRAVEPVGNGRRLVIDADFARELRPGESVAVDGVCLTATAASDGAFQAEAVAATLSLTTLGRLEPGEEVNLERALAVGDRIGGHLVQGHVDGVGEVLAVRPEDEQILLDVRIPAAVAEISVLHGSITLAGVSLTIHALPEPDVARVALIPYTWNHTTLRDLRVGDGVNVEGDMLGRFVVQYLERTGRGRSNG